jgi:serine/threonine-protein kinase
LIGKTLAQYQITELIGKGGMGEVYRALDTKLGREVAIKVLPPTLVDDPERVARFQREARTLASLTDAHIATLYGMEEAEGQRFLVMELAPGEDLARRLQRAPLSREEALDVAIQIAKGLEAAHARGIIHRDLKPANVMVDADLQVKILDFGLARAVAVDQEDDYDENSPTITANLTQAGTLLGTAAYMSPEQVRGHTVDHRSDIWAFGVILYEMLSGVRLFGGESVSDDLAGVLKSEPEWERLPGDLPPSILRVLRRCLHKDRRERLQAIGDARLELQDAGHDPMTADSMPTKNRRGAWIAATIAALVLGFVGGTALFGGDVPRDEVASEPVVRSSIRLPEGVELDGSGTPVLALSPDGLTLAFVGREDDGAYLYIRPMDTGEAVKVPDSHGAEGPFFSPDGQWVGFGCGSISGAAAGPPRLSKAPVDGGPTQTLCRVRDYFGGAWSEDGTVYWIDAQPGGLWAVDSDGGTPREIGGNEASALFWPQLLPGGESVLAIDQSLRRGAVVRVDTENGATTDLGIDASMALLLPTGHLLLGRDAERELVLQRFDLASEEALDGQAVVLRGVSVTRNNGVAFAASSEGTLVYSLGSLLGSGREMTEIMRLDFDGTLTPIGLPTDRYQSFAPSPDGQRIVAAIDEAGLWVIDVARGTRLRLPAGETRIQWRPLWSPDGEHVVWTGFGGRRSRGSVNLYSQPADGVTPPRQLDERIGEFWAQTWIPGTNQLVDIGWHTQLDDGPKISTVPIDGSREPEVLMSFPGGSAGSPRIRPDGKWIAYTSRERGERAAYLRSLPDLARKIPVGQANQVRWSVDGNQLILMRDGVFRRVSVTDAADGGVVLGNDVEFARVEGLRGVRIDPLGRGLLLLRQVPGTGTVKDVQLVRGWYQEVEELLPGR